ncbi:MAG: TolC family protein [Prevotellaceae bacterium]|jgi:outer membrane protein TolC|nr:TolC family protein [Prevotellaceae bacterium]
MNTRYLFLALILSAVCRIAGAQEVMTLEKCRETALENNKSGAIATLNSDKAAYTGNAYRANYFPKISASGNYLHTGMQMSGKIPEAYLPTFVPNPATGGLSPNIVTGPDGNPLVGADGNPVFREYAFFPGMDLSLGLKNFWMAGVKAEQPIYTGGKIASAYRMAQIGREIAGLNLQLSRAEIVVKTDEAYWTCIQTNELLKLALSYRETLGELLRSVQAAEEAGMKHRNDALKVQVKMNEAELQLRRAENGLRLARRNLCYVMGIPPDSELRLPESFEGAVPEDVVAKAVEGVSSPRSADCSRRPEYAMLEKQTRLKEQEIALVRSDFLPKVGVVAGYGYTNGGTLNGNKLFDRASFSVLASVNVPLFQWGEGRNKIRAAKAERDIARLQHENLGEQMALELSRAVDKCDESTLEVKLTEHSLLQAEENRKVCAMQYEGGMETLSAYLEAQTAWQQARMEHVNALTRQQLNETYYLKAKGILGGNSEF